MDIVQRFQAYAADFERSYVDDDWSRLVPYFTEGASYDSGDGSNPALGRDAILQKLEGAVNGLDRRMGQRDLAVHNVLSTGDTVTADWTIRFSNDALPTLEISGREVARFSGDAISEMRSEIAADSMLAFEAWMQAHGGQLGD